MGAFITNLHVRRATTPLVCKAVANLTRLRAHVSPATNGWVTVYPEETEPQDEKILFKIASGLSKILDTEVLGFMVHDSDIALYWLYQQGALVDEFNSAPDYFKKASATEHERVRGNIETLLPLCLDGTTRAQLEAILHPTDGFPLMAEEILTDLAALLGIDDTRVSLGFNYFEEEGEDLLPDIAAFEPVGEGAMKKEARFVQTHAPSSALDTYPLAIAMLTQVWRKQNENAASIASILGTQSGELIRQMREGFDRGARDLLKHSSLPDRPDIEELKAARDRGPEALAEFLAEKTPQQLTAIGIAVVPMGLDAFITALLKHGLDPNASDARGWTMLNAAEQLGMDSTMYRLVKSAADRMR